MLDISAQSAQSLVESSTGHGSSSTGDEHGEQTPSQYQHHLQHQLTPMPEGRTNGLNGSASSKGPPPSNPKVKSARRKLSFTAPLLGFGKKDKHKDKVP